jgi:hypothetical protein
LGIALQDGRFGGEHTTSVRLAKLFDHCGLRSKHTDYIQNLPVFLQQIASLSHTASEFLASNFGLPATLVLPAGSTVRGEFLQAGRSHTPYLLVTRPLQSGPLGSLEFEVPTQDDDDMVLYTAIAIAVEDKMCHPVFVCQFNKWYNDDDRLQACVRDV